MPLVESRRIEQMSHPTRPVDMAGVQQVLFKRAAVLADKDRLILEMVYKNNLSIRQVARILQRSAGTISRTVQRLCARLRDPLVAALLEPDCQLTPQYRQLAIEFFAQGRRISQIAESHQISIGEVRQIISFVRGWHRGVHINRR